MLTLPHTITAIIGACALMFSKHVFKHVRLLNVGAILAPEKRTLTFVLRGMGRSHTRYFQSSHRVLHRAQWAPLRGGHILLQLLLRAFVPLSPVVIRIDANSERRRGEKSAAKGIDWDPVRPSHAHFVRVRGMGQVGLMLLAPVMGTTCIRGCPS